MKYFEVLDEDDETLPVKKHTKEELLATGHSYDEFLGEQAEEPETRVTLEEIRRKIGKTRETP